MPDAPDMDYMTMGGDMCAEMTAMFEMLFMMMDADGSNTISASEAIDFGITAEELEMFAGFDMDGDEELSMEELEPVFDMALAEYGCEGL